MTNRTSSLLFLFVAAFLVTAVVLALAVPTLSRVGLPTGPWMLPATALLCFVGVFFAGREYVLPEALRRSPAHALGLVILWVTATMISAMAVVWVLQLLRIAPTDVSVVVPIWFGSFFVSNLVLHRMAARRSGAASRDRPALP